MKTEKKNYLLIHGAWLGAWIWRDMIDKLRLQGHNATALTLTGIGERAHNATAETNLTTHITDVIAHIEMEDLQDIILVGWSYGGMVISGVATKVPDRIRSLIYFDSAFPESGKALGDYFSPENKEILNILHTQGLSVPPQPFSYFGVTSEKDIAWMEPRVTPQPVMTFIEPLEYVELPEVPICYVNCSGYDINNNTFTETWQRLKKDPRINCVEMKTNHFMMLSEPDETLSILLENG